MRIRTLLAASCLAMTLVIGVATFFGERVNCQHVMFFGPSGRLAGIKVFDSNVALYFSPSRFGAERAWSMVRVHEPAIGSSASFNPRPPSFFHLLDATFDDEASSLLTHGAWDFDQENGFQDSLTEETVLDSRFICVSRLHQWNGNAWQVVVPSWLVLSGSFILSLLLFGRRRWARPGHCKVCGYDLRATPDRCPECGTETSPQKP